MNEIAKFREILEKDASALGRVAKFLFPRKNKISERFAGAAKSIGGSAVIAGGIGAGGLAYGSMSQPGSIMNDRPSGFN